MVIPAYNAAGWIGDAIASVIAQAHRDWSLIVVDDGSTDGTGEVVAGFADHRIRMVRHPNAGVSAARNRGVEVLAGGTPTLVLPGLAAEGSRHQSQHSLSREAGEACPRALDPGGWGGGAAYLFLDADDSLARSHACSSHWNHPRRCRRRRRLYVRRYTPHSPPTVR